MKKPNLYTRYIAGAILLAAMLVVVVAYLEINHTNDWVEQRTQTIGQEDVLTTNAWAANGTLVSVQLVFAHADAELYPYDKNDSQIDFWIVRTLSDSVKAAQLLYAKERLQQYNENLLPYIPE